MIVTVGKGKDGGAVVVVGLPRRSQDYMRRGQPAVLESDTLRQADAAQGVSLTDTTIAMAFVEGEDELLKLMSGGGYPWEHAVTAADRLEDLKELLVEFLKEGPELPAGEGIGGHVGRAIAALTMAIQEARKAGAS